MIALNTIFLQKLVSKLVAADIIMQQSTVILWEMAIMEFIFVDNGYFIPK